ncbi:hypothetical protein J8273_5441 [Carpediemonas membranifera]|uniref:Uncharacterized protein n=1 Tax=Carpediemonas membranifera TaxID=201153 RepID=A0A8J6B1S9_9EUKA|nr:hypothetical protein J8273_5441 [Carpediemonas membranifera]|eukprot:KAG9392449.1 hypothetical protein J8273_5441 [Carpediemonas membranifera]
MSENAETETVFLEPYNVQFSGYQQDFEAAEVAQLPESGYESETTASESSTLEVDIKYGQSDGDSPENLPDPVSYPATGALPPAFAGPNAFKTRRRNFRLINMVLRTLNIGADALFVCLVAASLPAMLTILVATQDFIAPTVVLFIGLPFIFVGLLEICGEVVTFKALNRVGKLVTPIFVISSLLKIACGIVYTFGAPVVMAKVYIFLFVLLAFIGR